MASSSGTTSSNNMIEDHVTVFVAYDGKWEWDGKEWLFKNSKGSIMVVSKYVTVSQITDILCTKFDVDQDCGLKLEVHYRVGSPWFPIIEIESDEDLLLFISESSKTKLPLCVTVMLKDDVAEGVGQDAPRGRKDDRVENRLYKAITEDNWVKAQEIVNTEEVTWTSKLDYDGNTALHFAVGEYPNIEVAKNILRGLNPELVVTNDGTNPAHIAAIFGYTEALKILCSNPKCLFTPDKEDFLAIHYALMASAIKTFLYLFKQMKSYTVEFDLFMRGMSGLQLLLQVIDAGLIDIAYELINDYPSMATPVSKKDVTPLEWIIRNPDLFYSGTHYNLCQRFVYHYVPIENNSLGSTDTADVENQESVTKRTRRCLHDVISRICVKLWETTLVHGKDKLPPN